MFQNVKEICPEPIYSEMVRLGRVEREWVEVVELNDSHYLARAKHPTWLQKMFKSGYEAFGMQAMSTFVQDGPKVFRPTVEQCAALAEIEVRLELSEYAQPYPAILIDFPEPVGRFKSVLCHLWDNKQSLSFSSFSIKRTDDIVTTVRASTGLLEASLQKFDDDVRNDVAKECGRSLRIAANACLALVNFGCQHKVLYAKQYENDRNLANENSVRGLRARERVKQAVKLVTFKQDIELHTSQGSKQPGEPTGREMPAHWRKGHWAMQVHGPNNSLRKRILRAPVLVRADLFGGDKGDTEVTYRG